jgi:carboxypeptidase Q
MNRLIGNPGHQATIDYLVATTSALDYYNVTTQAFQVPSGVTTLTVGGTAYHSDIMTLSPGGHPVAPVVAVPNLGCDAVSLQAPPVYTRSKYNQESSTSCFKPPRLSIYFKTESTLTALQTDYPDLTGKIALISRGTCQFGLKAAYAGGTGAVGVLIYNNAEGALLGTLSEEIRPEGPYVPTIGISQADGLVILASLNSEVIADLEIDYTEITT